MLEFLHGYVDAPLEWFKTFRHVMQTCGYKSCVDEPGLFYKINNSVYSITTVIVDDLVSASKPTSFNDD